MFNKNEMKSNDGLVFPQLQFTPLIELYDLMNKNQIKNRVDSQYWITGVETKIIKQENAINKRFCKVTFFNRNMNENGNLMRLYICFNQDHIIQERFEIDPKYNNPNILYFIVERDLAEDVYDVDIEAYIADGKKIDINAKYIGQVEVHDNVRQRNVLVEKYFKNNVDNCLTLPTLAEDYWVCTCGRYHKKEVIVCPFCGVKKDKLEEMIGIKAENLLEGINERLVISVDESVNDVIQRNADMYFDCYGIDKEKTIESINREMLLSKQQELVEQEIQAYLTNNPIVFNTKLSFKDNVNQYCHRGSHGAILPKMIFNKLDLGQCQYLYDKTAQDNLEKKNQYIKYGKIFGILVGIILIAILALSFIFRGTDESNVPPTSELDEESESYDTTQNKEESFKLLSTDFSLKVGEGKQLECVNLHNKVMIYAQNPTVVSISVDGMVTALAPGKTTITAIDDITKYTAIINVEVTGDNSSENVIVDSSTRMLSENDLVNLTKDQLRIARNEMYARHGCLFEDQDLQNHFNQCSWYKAGSIYAKDAYDILSEIEKSNAELIHNYESKLNN